MNAPFDREALATLRAMLRVAVMSLTSGLHHLLPEIASSKAARAAMRANRAAFEALRDNDAAPTTRDLSDELADVFDIVCAVRDALAPLAREGFGPIELYSRAAVARAAPVERRGAPIAEADNVVRLPANAGHALASDERRGKAGLARGSAMWRDADRVAAAIHFIKANWGKTAKPAAALRRVIDACHEVQKLYVNDFDADRETQVLAEYMEARLVLAGAGVGDEEIDAAFQRVVAERETRCPAGTRAARVAYVIRTLVGAACPAIVASGTRWRLPPRARRSPRGKAVAGTRTR